MAVQLGDPGGVAMVNAIAAAALAGQLEILAADATVLARKTFAGSPFLAASAAGGFATALADLAQVSPIPVIASGNAATFRVTKSGGATLWSGSVSTAGADLNLSSIALVASDTVSLTSWSITLPTGA